MNEETMTPATSGMTVSQGMKDDLLTTAKWMKFLCIIGCIGVALMLILGLAMFFVGASIGGGNTPLGAGMGFLYLILAAIYIYPIIKGFQFANGTKAACLTDNEYELARGFAGLRDLLRFMGILAIVCIVIYVLIFFGMFIVGLTAL